VFPFDYIENLEHPLCSCHLSFICICFNWRWRCNWCGVNRL